MRGFFTHLRVRLRLTLTSPDALVMIVLAGLSSLLLWPWLLGRLDATEPVLDLLIQPGLLFMWSMMLAVAATAPTHSVRTAKGFGVRALPALPVAPLPRTLAELLPPLVGALLIRLAGGELLRLWLGTRDPFSVDPQGGLAFTAETLVGASIMLPVLAAWSPRPRVDWTFIVRPAVASVLMFVLVKQGSAADPFAAPLLGVVLAAGFYAIPDLESSRRAARRWPASPRERASRSRRGLDARARLRRDLWSGALRIVAPFAVAFAILPLAVPLADRFDLFGAEQADLWYGIVHGLSLSLFGVATLYPMGVHILKTDRLAGAGSLMSGAFCAAWATLPLRRESVARAIYLHVLLIGAAWFLFIVGFSLLAHLVVSSGLSWLRFYPPMVLALPALAGSLTCMAVGDRVRGTIALTALFLVLPAHIGSQLACSVVGLSARSPAVLAVDSAVLLLLGAVGGLPALVHLRRGSSGAEPRLEENR